MLELCTDGVCCLCLTAAHYADSSCGDIDEPIFCARASVNMIHKREYIAAHDCRHVASCSADSNTLTVGLAAMMCTMT